MSDTTGGRGGIALQGLPARGGRRADLRALAGRRRLRPRRRRLAGPTRSKPPFVIIQPPPNVTGSLHLGHAQRSAVEDPDDAPRADAGPPGALPARPGPCVSIAAQFVLDRIIAAEGETRASLGPRALPRAHVALHRRGAGIIAGQQRRRRRLAPTGAASASRWTRSPAARGPRGVRAPLSRGPRVPPRDADQLVSRVSDQPVRPRGRGDARRRARCGRSGTTWSTSDGATEPGRPAISVATTRPETILGDTARRRAPGRSALSPPDRPARPHPVRGARRPASSPTPLWTGSSGPAP